MSNEAQAKRIKRCVITLSLAPDVAEFLRRYPGQASRMIDASIRTVYGLADPVPQPLPVVQLVGVARPVVGVSPAPVMKPLPAPPVSAPPPPVPASYGEADPFFDDDFGDE